jgi:radical SAM superfamily enzyme YgiQ (UPF0313 family)
MVKGKVLLVNPPYVEHVYSGKLSRNAIAINIPLGLAYLGAVLEKNQIPVQAVDANVLALSVKETARRILKSDAKYIFITSTTNTITRIYEIIKLVKKYSETIKESKDVDIVVRSEGEYTALDIAMGKPLSEIDGITYRNDEKEIIKNKPRARIENLDELPIPARHLFPHKLYRPGAFFNTGVKNNQAITMLTSRGCPNLCTYCSSVHFWGTKVRFRSAQNIVNEVEYLMKTYDTKQIAILDDMFTAHIPRLKEFCNIIIEKKIKVRWWCYSRVTALNKNLMALMKKAGCYALNFGIESGNEEVIKRIKKNITKEKAWEVFSAAKELDILIHASFMVGLPGDTRDTVMDTINWAIKLNPHVPLFCITTPFPGTELYFEALEKGWMDHIKSWDDAGLHMKTKYHNDDLSAEDIYELYKLAQKKFFYRPQFFWTTFKRLIRHPNEIKGYLYSGIYMLTET